MSAPARQTRTAWIVLCAVLFAALSSTLAVLNAHDRAGFMADICSATGITKVLAADDGSGPLPGKSERGVHCADCLNSASLQAIVAPAVTRLFALVAGGSPPHTAELVVVPANPVLSPPPRGPPQNL